MNCLSVFDHFVGLVFKGLTSFRQILWMKKKISKSLEVKVRGFFSINSDEDGELQIQNGL